MREPAYDRNRWVGRLGKLQVVLILACQKPEGVAAQKQTPPGLGEPAGFVYVPEGACGTHGVVWGKLPECRMNGRLQEVISLS